MKKAQPNHGKCCIQCDSTDTQCVSVVTVFTVPVCEKHYKATREVIRTLLALMDWAPSPIDMERIDPDVDDWIWAIKGASND